MQKLHGYEMDQFGNIYFRYIRRQTFQDKKTHILHRKEKFYWIFFLSKKIRAFCKRKLMIKILAYPIYLSKQ